MKGRAPHGLSFRKLRPRHAPISSRRSTRGSTRSSRRGRVEEERPAQSGRSTPGPAPFPPRHRRSRTQRRARPGPGRPDHCPDGQAPIRVEDMRFAVWRDAPAAKARLFGRLMGRNSEPRRALETRCWKAAGRAADFCRHGRRHALARHANTWPRGAMAGLIRPAISRACFSAEIARVDGAGGRPLPIISQSRRWCWWWASTGRARTTTIRQLASQFRAPARKVGDRRRRHVPSRRRSNTLQVWGRAGGVRRLTAPEGSGPRRWP